MNPFKEFFEKLKKKSSEKKFKSAGPAHKLSESSSSTDKQLPQSSREQTFQPHKVSKEAERAGAAALERIQQQQQSVNWSSQFIKNQARKELELENSQKEKLVPKPKTIVTVQEDIPKFTVSGVYFTCPIIGPDVLTKDEIEDKIKEFLYDQLEQEEGLAACLMIYTLNKNKVKVQKGVETLSRYLTNIIDEPTEEKYHKIRIKNKIFQERIVDLEGALEFLFAAGFSQRTLKSDNEQDEYLVYDVDNLDIEKLQMLKEAILSAEPIIPVLDRNLRVLRPAQAAEKVNLPQEFFHLTLDDIKREQESKAETVELLTQLRTKEMRERDEIRERHTYRFSLIRVRFPDGIILQGTFSVYEKFHSVKEFVADNLMDPSKEFDILLPGGVKLDDNQSLLEMKLVPAVMLNFMSSNGGQPNNVFLNSKCMSLLSDL